MSSFRHSLHGFSVNDIRARKGVAKGDLLGQIDNLILDDFYEISEAANSFRVLGKIVVEGMLRFDDFEGRQHLAVLIERKPSGQRILCPITDMSARQSYRLIGAERCGNSVLGQLWLGGFLSDTMITLADGQLRPIHLLQVDDQLRGEDDSTATVVSIRRTHKRACGLDAPVCVVPTPGSDEQNLSLHYQHAASLKTAPTGHPKEAWVEYYQLVLDHAANIQANGHWVPVCGANILTLGTLTCLELSETTEVLEPAASA